MTVAILKVLVITSLAISCLSAKTSDGDKYLLNGVWQAEHLEIEGEAASPEAVRSILVTVEDNRLLVRLDGENSRAKEALFKTDSTKSPGRIDISTTDEETEPVLGIYELRNDTLKVCLKVNGGAQRPDKFETRPDSEQILLIFKKLR